MELVETSARCSLTTSNGASNILKTTRWRSRLPPPKPQPFITDRMGGAVAVATTTSLESAAIAAATSLSVMIAFVPGDASRAIEYLCVALFGTVVPT